MNSRATSVVFGAGLIGAAACGLVIAASAIPGSMAAIAASVAAVAVILVAYIRPLERIPHRKLLLGFCVSIGLYFVWPRYVFLPVSFLPVRHPQRILYLLLIAMFAVVLLKCSAARVALWRGLARLPIISGTWLFLIVWQLLGALVSAHPAEALSAWFLDVLVVYLLYPIAILCLSNSEDVEYLGKFLAVAALINVAFAMVETVVGHNLFQKFLMMTLDPSLNATKEMAAAKIRDGQYRAQAAFDHPILFAEYLTIVLPFVLVRMVSTRGFSRFLCGGLSVALVLGLYLSHSRVALAATAVALGALVSVGMVKLAASGKRSLGGITLIMSALPLLMLGFWLSYSFVAKVSLGRSAEEASSTNSRMQMLYQGGDLLLKSPFFGYGPAQGAETLGFKGNFGAVTLDNYFLLLALDSGIPALVAYATLLIVGVITMLKAIKRLSRESAPDWIYALPAAFVAFYVIKAVLGSTENNLLLAVFFACLSLVTSLKCNNRGTNQYSSARVPPALMD